MIAFAIVALAAALVAYIEWRVRRAVAKVEREAPPPPINIDARRMTKDDIIATVEDAQRRGRLTKA